MPTRCVPILRNGRVEEWIAATDDVQDTWSTTLRGRLLAEIAQVSGGGLDESFAAVAKAIVPELADACVIILLDHEEWPPPEHVPVTARDAVIHAEDTLVLDIGDVSGHDLTAATTMGQPRSMLRGLAWNNGPECLPSAVLTMVEDAAEGLDIASFTTAVHARLQRRPDGAWHMTRPNAGHPPPLLIPARAGTRSRRS